MSHELKAGIYRHYTGLMVIVLGVARHSETEEKFVCYIPLGPKAGPRITIRPYEMFFEKVTKDGKEIPRFEFIDYEMPKDLAESYKDMKNWGQPG